MKKNRILWTGIVIPLLSAGFLFAADAGAESARRETINRVEPKLVPVPDYSRPRQDYRRGTVNVWTRRGDGALVHPGETVDVYFRTSRDAYVVVVDIDTKGRARVLFPTRSRDDGFVEAGRTVALPGRHAGYRLMVTGPAGLERIVAFASDQPLLDQWEDLVADELACLGCIDSGDFDRDDDYSWSASAAIAAGTFRMEMASGSVQPQLARGTISRKLVPVPVGFEFFDRDETWFRVSRGRPHSRW